MQLLSKCKIIAFGWTYFTKKALTSWKLWQFINRANEKIVHQNWRLLLDRSTAFKLHLSVALRVFDALLFATPDFNGCNLFGAWQPPWIMFILSFMMIYMFGQCCAAFAFHSVIKIENILAQLLCYSIEPFSQNFNHFAGSKETVFSTGSLNCQRIVGFASITIVQDIFYCPCILCRPMKQLHRKSSTMDRNGDIEFVV